MKGVAGMVARVLAVRSQQPIVDALATSAMQAYAPGMNHEQIEALAHYPRQ